MNKRQRQQAFWTIVFTVLLMALITMAASSCTARSAAVTFSKPKYEVSTTSRPHRGRPVVRQQWYKRWWFWQRDRRQQNAQP